MRIFLTLFLLFSLPGQAYEYRNVTISKLMIDKNHGDKVFVQLSVPQSSTAECHLSNAWHYVMTLSSGIDEKIYSMLLTLYASGKPARFYGTNSCDVHEKVETLYRLEMQ